VSPDTFFVRARYPGGSVSGGIAHLALFGMDLILTEGSSPAPPPDRSQSRGAGSPSPVRPGGPPGRRSSQTGTPERGPAFRLEDIVPLADFIEREYLHEVPPPEVEILVGGEGLS